MMGRASGAYPWRMSKRYLVTLTDTERPEIERLISAGKAAARTLAHTRILLKADQAPGGPAWTDEAIAVAVEVNIPTIERVRKRFVEESLEAALRPRPARAHKPRKLEGAQGGPPDLPGLQCAASRPRRLEPAIAGRHVRRPGAGRGGLV